MKKEISILSIISLLISITAFIISGTNIYTRIPWIILSVVSVFFPIVSKYFRKKCGHAGKAFEITAFVFGAFNFYFLLYVLTDINLLEILILVGLICLLYAILFNNIKPIKGKSETDLFASKNNSNDIKKSIQISAPLSSHHMISIILSIISVWTIIILINDVREKAIDPAVAYSLLIGANVIYIIFSIILKNIPVIKSLLAFCPIFFSIVALIEGSVFSPTFYGYIVHKNMSSSLVFAFNIVWVALSFLFFLINLFMLVRDIRSTYYHNIKYREKCYKRVAELKNYLDNGIISQEEFENSKQQILKNIKMH